MTSLSPHWATPKWLYDLLDSEFHFDYDPCPLGGENMMDFIPFGRNVILLIHHMVEKLLHGLKWLIIITKKARLVFYLFQAGQILNGGTNIL